MLQPQGPANGWSVPGESFFKGIAKALGGAPIVAEDLGVITEDVVALRESIDAPGMVVLQFGWGDDDRSPHLLHNHYENSFCYPGTHDNEAAKDGMTIRTTPPS